MGKVAVLVAGMFREFEQAYPTWEFIKHIEHDLYVSTWTTTVENNQMYGVFHTEDVTEERVRAVAPQAKVSIEPMQLINTHSGPMMYHWKKLFRLLAESKIEYDTVILTRTDIALKELNSFFRYIECITHDRIYALGSIEFREPPEYLFVADCLFLGKIEIMQRAFEEMPYCHPGVENIHSHLAKYFINSNIHIHSLGGVLKYTVLRYAFRDFQLEEFLKGT